LHFAATKVPAGQVLSFLAPGHRLYSPGVALFNTIFSVHSFEHFKRGCANNARHHSVDPVIHSSSVWHCVQSALLCFGKRFC